MAEEIGDRGSPCQQGGVRRDLLDHVALAGAPGAKLNKVVVSLAQRDQPGEKQHL